MLESRMGDAKAASEERVKEASERLGSDATIYTTEYGSQYVSPLDALFSRVEMLELVEEARAVARESERAGK